jgi:PKD repeat protein
MVSPQANFIIEQDTFCTNSPILFYNASNNATSYAWTFDGGIPANSSEINPLVSYHNAGVYSIQLIASNTLFSDTLIQTSFQVIDSPENPIVTLSNGILTTNAIGIYQWYLNGNPIPGENASSIEPTISGNYSLELINENGCSSLSEFVNYTGINALDSSELLTLFPNPVVDYLTLNFKSDKEKEVIVYASTGQQLKYSTLNQSGTIDFSEYPTGIYILAVKQDHVYSHFKIIHTQAPSH